MDEHIKHVPIPEVKAKIEQVFYRGKHDLKAIGGYVDEIYKQLGHNTPQIHVYNHPKEYKKEGDSGVPIITNADLSKKMQRLWCQIIADFKVDLEYFGRTYINNREPEEHQKKINEHWAQLATWPSDREFDTIWSHRSAYFYELVRPYAQGEPFYEALCNFHLTGVGWYRFNIDHAYVILNPMRIRTDPEGNLHSDMPTQPAVQWYNGDVDCYLWGVKFEYDMWNKIVNKKMKAKEAMKITNIEQRSKALRVIGYGDLVKEKYHVGTEEKVCYIWKDQKFQPVKNKYELYSIPGIYDQTAVKVVRYWCPSTGREYFSPVPPETQKPIDGMSWKFNLTRKEFMDMQVEG